ncbi:MAG: hypothetical protein COZ90_00555 [Candidatus Nealsonbacteria bacterium CG_4_8_14_3_um_filter_37_36]|uniref:DUF6938 domain-containing protein n=4 Tax=Candidatus Nealsoniibacteriota TaxID=1817911 RepID=A0A2H9N1I8_9BACT|nr:MAG: hypothetical protein COW25_01775 [Candidatus Nealsonbacteria bacterium CG15_BIG_FIL_POST_REV_8_21_14_020_37_12]PIW91500.1 MAG: hypothetical protein COZ90_00555 [Candidatus Nealsonbacteria bacterium CG_4_8_14_3_um_filter_37_36]PJA83349.1 MAG: hypothetical protein CO146_01355 [Candidatus Nealsonbacteria bacterium CG_4_9_14_3_um_filter_37_29]
MEKKVWVISVNMGYGHQRTAYPLRNLTFEGKIINANDYQGIPEKDKAFWESMRRYYEALSRFSRIPLIGKATFSIYDEFQKILGFYPKRDLSKPNFALRQIYSLLKKGWGKDLIEKLKENPLPLISTFFTPAFMAEFFNYPGEIFCVVCDADISRTWAPINPGTSKIKYFAPTERVVERLKLYGVRSENIFLTGYPLPLENIGSEKMETLKEDLRHRILNLDPQKKYFEKYKILVEESLGALSEKSDHPLTIMFSVGGAGAQKEIAIQIVKSLRERIKRGEIKIILSAGIREKVKEYFEKEIGQELFLTNLDQNVEILYQEKIENYFKEFNQKLRKTDILWTKPSELSFYAALGLPIIIAPPIGSQEEFNKRWLLKSGFGALEENPSYTDQWLFDWLNRGYLAEAAMEGFIEGEKLGTINIQKIIEKCFG